MCLSFNLVFSQGSDVTVVAFLICDGLRHQVKIENDFGDLFEQTGTRTVEDSRLKKRFVQEEAIIKAENFSSETSDRLNKNCAASENCKKKIS